MPHGAVSVQVAEAGTLAVPALSPYPDALSYDRRRKVLKDLRAIDELGLRAAMMPAADAVDEAIPLIAEVKRRHAVPEHPRLMAMRLRAWIASTAGPCIATLVRGPDGGLVAAGFIGQDGRVVEAYEIGLRADFEHRHLAYVEAMVYGPLRWAIERGCDAVQIGIDSATPKRLRGATLEPVHVVRF